jgi:hypothetical protein
MLGAVPDSWSFTHGDAKVGHVDEARRVGGDTAHRTEAGTVSERKTVWTVSGGRSAPCASTLVGAMGNSATANPANLRRIPGIHSPVAIDP